MKWGMPLCLAWLALMLAAGAQDAGTFTVLEVQNEGTYKTDTGFKPVAAKQAYPFGTVLKTGRRSVIDLELSPGNTFRLMPRSQVTITRDSQDPNLKVLRLEQGTVDVKLDKLPAGHKLRVQTPTAVCGALGTRFSVSFEDDEDEEKAAKKKGTRENRFVCTEGKTQTASRFTVKGDAKEGVTFTAPVAKGTEIVAIVHEGKENSYTDISVNRGTLAINYGVKQSGQLTAAAAEGKPARFVCALEKSAGEVDGAALEVKSGVVTHTVRKGFVFKSDETTELTAADGAVVVHNQDLLKADKNTAAADFLAATRTEGELHSRLVDLQLAGTAARADEDALAAATEKASKLRRDMLAERTLKLLKQIRRAARRPRTRP